MCSRENHSDYKWQLANILAEISSTSSPGVLLHDWLDEDFEESLNDEEIDEFVQINRTKKPKAICEDGETDQLLLEKSVTFWTSPQKDWTGIFLYNIVLYSCRDLDMSFELLYILRFERLCIIICMCHAYGNTEYILVSMQYGMLYSCGEYFHLSFGLYTPALVQYPPVLHGN